MKRTPVVVLLGAVLMVAIVFGVWMSRRPSGAGGPDTTNLVPRAPTNLVLRVPNTKFMGLLPLYVAEDKGFFRREGVDLKWVDVKDPQQAANLLFDGQADFLMTTFAGVLPAESRQAGTLKFLCAVGEVGSRPGSFILVASNSPVQSVRDLRGKVVGTYSGGSQKAYALIVLERLGLKEPADYRLVQVPSSAQVTSLLGGTFDALFTVEPYGSQAIEKGARVLDKGLRPRLLGDPFWLGSGTFTTKFLGANPGAYDRVKAALSAADRYIAENEKEARTLLVSKTSTEPAVAAKCALYRWDTAPGAKELSEIQAQFDLLESSKMIDKAPRASETFSHP